MEILLIGIIILYIMSKRKSIDTGKFIKDNGDWLQKLKESDYDFLVSCKKSYKLIYCYCSINFSILN